MDHAVQLVLDLPTIEKVAIGVASLYCCICGAIKTFYIFKSSKHYEDYECETCHLIHKVKVE